MDHDGDGILEHTVKFNRTAIEDFDLPPETPCSLYTSGANSAVFKGFSKSSIVNYLREIDYNEETENSYEVELRLTGKVAGVPFEGTDVIRVISKGK